MDLRKIEQLSCLKINKEQEQVLEKSLNDIVYMLQEIEALNISSLEEEKKKETVFRNVPLQNYDKSLLPMEDKYFLAPKVLKKD